MANVGVVGLDRNVVQVFDKKAFARDGRRIVTSAYLATLLTLQLYFINTDIKYNVKYLDYLRFSYRLSLTTSVVSLISFLFFSKVFNSYNRNVRVCI